MQHRCCVVNVFNCLHIYDILVKQLASSIANAIITRYEYSQGKLALSRLSNYFLRDAIMSTDVFGLALCSLIKPIYILESVPRIEEAV